LRTRTLGEGGPEVSVVGLGTNNFGARCDYEQSLAVIDAALDAGITLFDTADIYSQGMSEDFIGRALEGRRDRVVLATKFGKPMDERPADRRGTRDYIRWAVEGSLRRLRTGVIDVLQMHEPDEGTPIEETLAALDDLVHAGKVRYIGNSNFSGWQLADAAWHARTAGMTPFVSAQNQYSWLERGVETDVIPACGHYGLGMLPFYPLSSGLLTGKYARNAVPPAGGRLSGERYARRLAAAPWDRIEAIDAYARARGLSMLEVAIGGLAAQPAVSSVIAGATTPAQVAANVAAGSWVPTADDLAELQSITAPIN
jgi:aryl-alcohol dehydrogenase-like predicted oxidoreductase